MTLAAASSMASGVARLVEPWAHLYADSKTVATIVTFGHVASLLMAGGFAVATDRATLRTLRLAVAERVPHLEELASVHRLVVGGLALSVITGALLFASDVETFLGSWIFWLKMALICVLLANGYMMTRAEDALRADAGESAPGWVRLRRSAVVSVWLWYTITLAGVALVNVA